MDRLTIQSPIARAEVDRTEAERIDPAPRLADLNGARIGLFWNGKNQGDVALAHTRSRLEATYDSLTFVDVFGEKGGLTRYAAPEQLDHMAETCDAVILTTAD